MYSFLRMAVIFLSLKDKCKGSDNSVICKLINPLALKYLWAIMMCVRLEPQRTGLYSYYGDIEGRKLSFLLEKYGKVFIINRI